MKRNKKLAGILVGALAVSTIAGSFAYYSSEQSVDNTMGTGSYGETLTEIFTPDDNWEPGEEADKIVGVTNTGDYDIVVRVKMSETWTLADGNTEVTTDSIDTDFTKATVTTGVQDSAIDGLATTDTDGSVVYKELLNTVTGTGTADSWYYNSTDGYWYYTSVLSAGEATTSLLSSITLSVDTDMGVYTETTYYAVTTSVTAPTAAVTETGTWTVLEAGASLADVEVGENEYLHIQSVSTLTDDKEGYADAEYVLTITSETCQATEAAVVETFDDVTAAIKTAWFPAE